MLLTLTIELAPELQAELTRQAAEQGVGIDTYATGLVSAGLLGDAAPVGNRQRPTAARSQELVDAVECLKSFGKTHGLSLGGMTIRDLRHEARP